MKKLFVVALCSLFCMGMQAQSIPAKLMDLHPADEHIECGFTEVSVMPKIHKTETREGTLTYQAPDYLRLDFNEPKGDYMLFDAEKVEQCKNGKTQSVKIKNRDNRYSRYRATLLSCLAGDIENAALLNGAKYTCKQEGKKYICTITAEHASSKDVKQIELEYDATTGKVLKIVLTEGNGNYATYTTHIK